MSFRYHVILVCIIVGISIAQAQIPNGSFELWEDFYAFEKPLEWSTNQDSVYTRFERDSLATDGNYSLKILSGVTSSWLGCYSRAMTGVGFSKPISPNSALTFYTRIIPMFPEQGNGVFLRLWVFAYSSGNFIDQYEWRTLQRIDEFTKIEVPLPGDNIDSLLIHIDGGAASSPVDGPCGLRSVGWIDNMKIDSATTSSNALAFASEAYMVYPNPSTGKVYINRPGEDAAEYQLFTAIGNLIEQGKLSSGHINIPDRGIYILRLLSGSDTFPIIQVSQIVIR